MQRIIFGPAHQACVSGGLAGLTGKRGPVKGQPSVATLKLLLE